jgi:hypothetical protein
MTPPCLEIGKQKSTGIPIYKGNYDVIILIESIIRTSGYDKGNLNHLSKSVNTNNTEPSIKETLADRGIAVSNHNQQ